MRRQVSIVPRKAEKTTSRKEEPSGKQGVSLHNPNKSFIVSERPTSVSRPVLEWIQWGRQWGRADLINDVINGANFTWTPRIITSCSPSPSSCPCMDNVCLYNESPARRQRTVEVKGTGRQGQRRYLPQLHGSRDLPPPTNWNILLKLEKACPAATRRIKAKLKNQTLVFVPNKNL